jgi:F-type H+-transporting ATPase subunit epsilon
MSDSFRLQVATPERLLLDLQVAEAEWPAANGNMGVLPAHAPLITMLSCGLLTYSVPGATGRAQVRIENGFAEVLNDQVRLLTDKAEIAKPADEARKS